MYSSVPELASGIFSNLGEPTGLTTGYIATWLGNSVGSLNIAIHSSYTGISGVISPWLGQEEQNIYEELFNQKYFERQISMSLSAAAYDTWIEIEDEGSRVRRVSKNDLAKTYQKQLEESRTRILRLVASYNQNGASPVQVVGDDVLSPLPAIQDPGYRHTYGSPILQR